MKKRILKSGLVLVLAISMLLTGCSGSSTESGNEEAKEAEVKMSDMPTMEEQVMYEKDGLCIKAMSLGYMEASEYLEAQVEVNLQLENEGTEDLVVTYDGIAVNGYMQGGYETITLPAGKKAKAAIIMYDEDLQKCGFSMGEIGEIAADFTVCTEEWEILYTTGLVSAKTSISDSVEVKKLEGGTEIYNANGITVEYLEVAESEFDIDVKLLISNTGDKAVMTSIYGAILNGSADVNTYNTPAIYAGTMIVENVGFDKDSLAEAGIETIEQVDELSFSITDYETGENIGDVTKLSFSTK